MRANYLQTTQRAQVSRTAMAEYLQRATVDKHIDAKIKEHEGKRLEEMSAFAKAIDANWLYTLHVDPRTRFGAKRLRCVWEAAIRNRIAFRTFLRDGHSAYVEQPTGQNVEDEATIKALLAIGVDIKAWEAEKIYLDEVTGEVSFSGGACPSSN